MKLFRKLALFAFVLLALAALAAWLLVPPAAKRAVEDGSSYAFGVPTSVEHLGANLGTTTSGLAMRGYRVESPAGFAGKPLLTVDRLSVGVGTRSLLGEPKVLDELVLEGLELHVVQRGLESNLLPVLREIKELATRGPSEPDEKDGDAWPGPRLRIGRVRIAGVAASVELSGIPGVEDVSKRYVVPTYDEDWSARTGEGGVTVAEFAGLALQDLSARAVAAAEGELPSAAVTVLRTTLEGGFSGGFEGALQGALKGVEKEAKSVLDAEIDELRGKVDAEKDALEKKADEELERLKKKTGIDLEALKKKAPGIRLGGGG